MAHFAKLDENNIVTQICVISNEIITVNGKESEQAGIDFLLSLYGNSNWKQTSYNNKFRGRYAGIGDTYDLQRDAFIPPKPFPSWVLNETTYLWEAPIPYPEILNSSNDDYRWSEEEQNWINKYAN